MTSLPNEIHEVEAQEPVPLKTETEQIIELTYEHFGDNAERMLEIAECESGLSQTRNGEVLMSPTRDFGAYQINEKTWDKTFTEMGLDYKNNLQDNILAAKYIYSQSGEGAWVCSRLI